MSAHEVDIARQLIALAPLLRGDWHHVHFAVRPALFEAAVGLADLLRPELGEEGGVLLHRGRDHNGKLGYEMWLRMDAAREYAHRHRNCCAPIRDPNDDSGTRNVTCENLIVDGGGPTAWEELHEFRALRIWRGLTKALLERPVRTIESDDGMRIPVLDTATLARLRELADRVLELIEVEDVHGFE